MRSQRSVLSGGPGGMLVWKIVVSVFRPLCGKTEKSFQFRPNSLLHAGFAWGTDDFARKGVRADRCYETK